MNKIFRYAPLMLASLFSSCALAKAHNAPSNEILNLPLLNEKQIIAHNMTTMLHTNNPIASRANTGTFEMFDPQGATKNVGGAFQVQTLMSAMDISLDLKSAIEFEIRAAKTMGLDGFQFWYPTRLSDERLDDFDKIIQTYIEVATELNIDFKVSLAICNPYTPSLSTEQMVKKIGLRIKNLISSTNNSEHWLRTPDGRLITFLWIPNRILTDLKDHWNIHKYPEKLDVVAQAFYDAAEIAGEKDMAYVYHLQNTSNDKHIEGVFDNFPAIWGWTGELDNRDEQWKKIANMAKVAKRDYTQSTYPTYYTSKMFEKRPDGKWGKLILNKKDVIKASPDSVIRWGHITNLTEAYRKHLQLAIETDTKLINYITWNDYPEGHHLAPGINNNFSYGVLLNYYKQIWKTGKTTQIKDQAAVFYKKYPSTSIPKFNIEMIYKEHLDEAKPSDEDRVEIVSMLTAPADIYYNKKKIGEGKKGLNIHSAKIEIGNVYVEIKRKSKTIISLNPKQKITSTPLRTDRTTVGYSSEFDDYFNQIFSKFGKKYTVKPTLSFNN